MRNAGDTYVNVARIVYVLGDMLSQGAKDALEECLDIVWLHMSGEECKLANERLESLGVAHEPASESPTSDEPWNNSCGVSTSRITIGQTEDAMRVPFTTIVNNQLGEKLGDTVQCRQCGEEHPVERGFNSDTGKPSELLLFAQCGHDTLLVGIDGRAIK